jgi:hypothetical protein
VKLYDLLAEGYHTPLSSDQIADLVRVGRLQKNTPCKEVGQQTWRTIDELFPLLKYGVVSDEAADNDPSRSFNREPLIIGSIVAAFTSAVLRVSLVYPAARNTNSSVASFQSQTHRSSELVASPASTPWPRTSIPGYAAEQSYRAAQLRQEQRAQQLEQDRRASEQIIEERNRAYQQQPLPRSAEQEFTVPLGAYTRVSLGGVSYRVAIHDDGPDEIRVLVGYRPFLRFQKRNGFEARDMETLILSNGNSRLYYVNEISDHVGHCKLRLRDE